MKRILKIVFSILCLLLWLFPITTFAANKTFYLDELGMSITLPNDWEVFTRDIKNNDLYQNLSESYKDSMMSFMLEENINLMAWSTDSSNDDYIYITMRDGLGDYSQLTTTELTELTSIWARQLEEDGRTCIVSDVYQHWQRGFLKTYGLIPFDTGDLYILEYCTQYSDKFVTIRLTSTDAIGSETEEWFEEIVDTICFDKDLYLNNGLLIIASVLLILVFSLPLVIYRYRIKKRPIDKKKARKLVLVYVVCMIPIPVMSTLLIKTGWTVGAIVMLWSWVNYRMLTGEFARKSEVFDGQMLNAQEALSDSLIEKEGSKVNLAYIRYCNKCGNELANGSIFCNKCGTKITEHIEKSKKEER